MIIRRHTPPMRPLGASGDAHRNGATFTRQVHATGVTRKLADREVEGGIRLKRNAPKERTFR